MEGAVCVSARPKPCPDEESTNTEATRRLFLQDCPSYLGVKSPALPPEEKLGTKSPSQDGGVSY
jgi:hypothetical protein